VSLGDPCPVERLFGEPGGAGQLLVREPESGLALLVDVDVRGEADDPQYCPVWAHRPVGEEWPLRDLNWAIPMRHSIAWH
jgi:hypothetical protein